MHLVLATVSPPTATKKDPAICLPSGVDSLVAAAHKTVDMPAARIGPHAGRGPELYTPDPWRGHKFNDRVYVPDPGGRHV